MDPNGPSLNTLELETDHDPDLKHPKLGDNLSTHGERSQALSKVFQADF
jgi:hypothetical protein